LGSHIPSFAKLVKEYRSIKTMGRMCFLFIGWT
jgi:hypothetical protein